MVQFDNYFNLGTIKLIPQAHVLVIGTHSQWTYSELKHTVSLLCCEILGCVAIECTWRSGLFFLLTMTTLPGTAATISLWNCLPSGGAISFPAHYCLLSCWYCSSLLSAKLQSDFYPKMSYCDCLQHCVTLSSDKHCMHQFCPSLHNHSWRALRINWKNALTPDSGARAGAPLSGARLRRRNFLEETTLGWPFHFLKPYPSRWGFKSETTHRAV